MGRAGSPLPARAGANVAAAAWRRASKPCAWLGGYGVFVAVLAVRIALGVDRHGEQCFDTEAQGLVLGVDLARPLDYSGEGLGLGVEDCAYRRLCVVRRPAIGLGYELGHDLADLDCVFGTLEWIDVAWDR